MGLYYYFGGSTPYNQTPSDQGKALKTTSDLLYGKAYDAAKTSALNLPSNADGAAFRANDGTYTYVLWAKTSVDLSESVNVTYNFPSSVIASANVIRKDWNFSETNSPATISKTNIVLTGTPSFFSDASGSSAGNQNPVANAGADQTITLPTNTATLNGTSSDVDGMIMSYAWAQISGPSPAGILSPLQSNTLLNNLVQGIYQFEFKVTDNLGAVGKDTVQIAVIAASGSSGATSTTRIEAENYSSMNGVQKENTSDAGGGQDVGYIDYGDWMDYSVNVSSAGTYSVNLRVASPYGGQFQIKNSAGSVVGTVTIPNTGGYQNWQTVSANISLAAGSQTVRIYSTSNGWNFNWWEVGGGSGSITTRVASTDIAVTTSTSGLAIYPNPVTDKFQLQINNDLTGSVSVQVYDMQGSLQKQFSVAKTEAGASQYYLSIGELASGGYIIKVTMNGWTESKQIIKQ
jgi:endoglucanase